MAKMGIARATTWLIMVIRIPTGDWGMESLITRKMEHKTETLDSFLVDMNLGAKDLWCVD